MTSMDAVGSQWFLLFFFSGLTFFFFCVCVCNVLL